MEKNRIGLSLKDLVAKNIDRIESFDYEESSTAYVLAQNKKDFVVLIKNAWVFGILETSNHYKLGDKIEVRPIAITDELILTDD